MPSRDPKTALRLAAVTLLGATVVLAQAVWLPMVLDVGNVEAIVERDWIAFYRTGQRLVQGQSELIYTWQADGGTGPDLDSGLFFLYPPFLAWLTIPLGYLGTVAGYLACVAAVFVGISTSFAGLLVLFRITAAQRLLSALALLGSVPWNAAVFLGHLGTLLFLPPVLALRAWAGGRPVLAGAFLGLLLAKPNLGLPVLALLVVARHWRLAAGAALAGTGMVVASLPLGGRLWADWWATMGTHSAMVADTIPVHKQATLLAAMRSLTGLPASHPLVVALWVSAAGLLAAWTARHWFRLGRDPEAFPRLLAVSLLAILVTNPYAYVYDLLLLAPAALLLWTRPGAWRHRTARRWGMGMTVAAYCLIYAQFLGFLPETLSLIGLPLAVWLVLELRELEGDIGPAALAGDTGGGGVPPIPPAPA